MDRMNTRSFLYHPVVRLLIGAASLCVGLTLAGLMGGSSVPRGAGPVVVGVVFIAYGLFNFGFAVRTLVKKKKS